MSTPRPWQGEDLPFGTVISNDLLGTMMVVRPPDGRGHRLRGWDYAIGPADHGAIWLIRLTGEGIPLDGEAGKPTYLFPIENEQDGPWQIIEEGL